MIREAGGATPEEAAVRILPVRYDPDLVEEVVFHTIWRLESMGGGRLSRSYRRRRKACYRLPEGTEREGAFADLHAEVFEWLGYDRAIQRTIAEFPALRGRLDRGAVKRVISPTDEYADLFVNDEESVARTVVLRMRVETFLDADRLDRHLRHEIGHVADMVDPAFDYRPDPGFPEETPARRRIILDRFRALWCVRIDGSLARGGRKPLRPKEGHLPGLEKAFACKGAEEILERAWSDPSASQETLLAAARDPSVWTARAAEAAAEREGPLPGSPCPTCSFPTSDWLRDPEALERSVVDRIRDDFPVWTPDQGICTRCAEIYSLTPRIPVPGPVLR